MKLNQRGLATIITTMIYILISVAILGLVVSSTIELIGGTKEQSNYNQMLDSFSTIHAAVDDSVINKQTTELIINNPGELTINCSTNQILGNISYKREYVQDPILIDNIVSYKSKDAVYFEYDLNNYTRIKLYCDSNLLDLNCSQVGYCYNTTLTKGKNLVEVGYVNYDSGEDTIQVSVLKKYVIGNE